MLTAITKDVLPSTFVSERETKNSQKKNLRLQPDHEVYALNLENALMSHFKYSEPEYSMKCAWNRRNSYAMEYASNEKIDNEVDPFCASANRGLHQRTYKRKSQGYVIYVSYRLEQDDTQIISVAGISGSQKVVKDVRYLKEIEVVDGVDGSELEDSMDGVLSDMDLEEEVENNDEIFGECDEKELLSRMETLEEEHKELQEKIKKLDHGRMWMENRLCALESTNQYQQKDEIAKKLKKDQNVEVDDICVKESDSPETHLDKDDKGFKIPGSSLKHNQN